MSTPLLDEAQRKLDAGDNDGAIDAAMLALAGSVEPARAARIAGRGLQQKGMTLDALLWLDRSLAQEPNALAFAWRGWCRYQRGEQDLALADFGRALEKDDGQPFARFARGLLRLQRKEVALAEADFVRGAESAEYRGASSYQLGGIRLAEGRLEQGRRDLAAGADAGNFAAAGQLASLEADTSSWTGEALVALAGYYRNLKEREFAKEAAALEAGAAKLTDPQKRHDALVSLGALHRTTKAWDESVDALRRAAGIRPKGPAPALAGRTLYFADRNRDAEAALDAALAAGAEPYEAHQTLGELRLEEKRTEEALASFDRALESATGFDLGRTQLARGRMLAALDRDDECKVAWLAAEKAGNSDAGKLRRERFGDETAGDFFDTALGWLNHGRWAEGFEPLEQAANLARSAVRAPGDFVGRQLSNILNNLGNALRRRGDAAGAIAVFEEAIRARPLGTAPMVSLGNLLSATPGRRKDALALFDRAADLALGDPGVHYNRGCARMAAGDGLGAASDFKKALAYQNASQRQDALFNLVKSLWKAGRFAEARAASVGAWVEESIDQATERNIEAMLKGLPRYEGNNVLVRRFADTLDVLLEGGKAEAEKHPFRFYGIHPDEWQEGGNMGHRYRLRFRAAPDAATRERIARSIGRPWTYVDDDGSSWLWSGSFALVTIGEREAGEFSEFFGEVQEWVMSIHEAAPLEEVVALNAERLSGVAWETWSLRAAPLPSAHPFDNDGALFFSAYGDPGGFPAPAPDPAFDAARIAAMPERDD